MRRCSAYNIERSHVVWSDFANDVGVDVAPHRLATTDFNGWLAKEYLPSKSRQCLLLWRTQVLLPSMHCSENSAGKSRRVSAHSFACR